MGIYGDRVDEELNESSTPGRDFLSTVVIDWEKESLHAQEQGLRVAIIRTGIVLSSHGGALEKMLPIYVKGVGGRLGSGQQWMSWIHLGDIANLFVSAATDESFQGVYNGVSPEPARNSHFSKELNRAVGRSEFLPVPKLALKVALGEAAEVILASARVLPSRLLDRGFKFDHPRLAGALDDVAGRYRDGRRELMQEQWLPQPPEKVFPFFCDENNLEVITPPFLGFHVIGKSTPTIENGTLIDYRLSLHGIPVKWQTRIENWVPGERFVDRQIKGPYQEWVHTHEFLPMAGGTLMRDRVVYKLPLGWVGDTSAAWRVSRDVSEIFSFRRKKIDELFGEGQS
jgi:ligand-binding SRPBCC domain-containing protein